MNGDGTNTSEGCLQILAVVAIAIAVAVWVTKAFDDPSVKQSPSPAPSVTAVAR